MKQCHICEKKMPKHVFAGHMRKRHPNESYEDGTKVGGVKTDILESKPESPSLEKVQENKFDYQKSETCASCGEEHPSILMKYHAHIAHGV